MNIYIPGTGFATQGPCDDGYHVPLQSDMEGLMTIMSGLSFSESYGYIYSVNLKMPMSGFRRNTDGTVNSTGQGYYWTSSSNSTNASYLYFNTVGNASLSSNYRASGMSIRPFKNEFVTPVSGWTVINGTLGGAGIFWNQTEGIISVTSDGSTGYTIADKNLGATVVYNNGDTLSESNCGKFYQRGNNNGFAYTGTITTSSTLVNAQDYGPGNYYSGTSFICPSASPRDWTSVQNANLRGGTDGNVPVTTMKEVQNIYIGEYTKPREPDSNTVVYWKLDGDAKDSSGNNRDGTVSGTLTYESIGSIDVAKFTGGQSVYRSGSEFTLNNNSSFTFSVWAKVTSWSSYDYSFGIQKTGEAGTWDKEIAIIRNGSVRGYYYTSDANWCTTNSGDVQLNQWYHLAYTYNGSVQKVYINGTLVKTNTPSSGSYTLSSPCLYLSRRYTSWYSPYKGYLSNFILQKNAWTADYISNYYNTYKGLYGLS